ncbi:Hypothetical protein SRAE_2000186900 [Strongyloides ratti]|uniref:Uncharacterized protein n=1 Tax=Strongyloides ratti TaxID=34506 RepID=A0A090MYH7_STRRB|nr:Hypothetical protein SRAE_2000186900 [Strongyloides ratti]CEF67204.1 Hypothetical protein SRAE_2000186900 [Strongyloides ratti]
MQTVIKMKKDDNTTLSSPEDILFILNSSWKEMKQIETLFFIISLFVIIFVVIMITVCLLFEHWGKSKLNKTNHKAWVTIIAVEEESRRVKASEAMKMENTINTQTNCYTTE